MTLKWPVIVLGSLLMPVITFAQIYNDPSFWDSIETAISGKRLLVDNYKLLEDVKTGALQQKDYNIYTRARYCQLLITDLKTEDSLFWQNATFIDSILLNPNTTADLQLPMHLMLAHRLQAFKSRPMYQKAGFYKGDTYKYASLNSAGFDSAILFHYERAKELSAAIGNSAPEKHIWLSSNPLIFLFKPTLYDIVQAEQIAYNTSYSIFNKARRKQFCEWLQLSPVDLIKALDTVSGNDRNIQVLKLYSNWLAFHKRDTAAFFYLETLLRKYIYEHIQFEKNIQAIYENYLQAQTESPIKEVKAHCIYQLCLLWHSRSLSNHLNVNKMPPAKALQLYEANRSLFDDFAYLGHILEEMKRKILVSEIKWGMDKVSIPGEPLLAYIEYKNTSNLYYRIIPVQQNEYINSHHDSSIIYLLHKPFLRAVNETLPVTDDHVKHSVLLKIDALPAGKYLILFSPNEIRGFESGMSVVEFEISQISIVSSGNRVYVLNRKNGHPLQGARVTIDYEESKKTNERIIGPEGYINIKRKEDFDVEVSYGKDTADDYDETASQVNGKLWDKESDGLLDFYFENARILILTDRGTYRPGQTVFYKGIVMTKHPYTGDNIIVNKKNLQHGLFRNILKKWLKVKGPELYIIDAFNRKVDTVKIKPNAYGSVTGSYRIPATAATGKWEIGSNIDGTSYGSGSFSVEEYKRPTFELTEEKPVRSYLPGDTVAFKLKVRSFMGGTMANTKIIYKVRRANDNIIEDGTLAELEYDSVTYTGENGFVDIIVSDKALQNTSLPDSVIYKISYELLATAVDQAGESHSLNTYLVVCNRPVNIKIPVREKYFIGDFKPLLVTAIDQNKVDLSKDIKVKLYKEKEGQVNPVPMVAWFADQSKYTKEQLQTWFPHMIFDREKGAEPELVYETTIKTGTGEKLRFPADIISAGVYIIKAACYENGILRGETKGGFTICDTVSHQIPGSEPSFFHVPFNKCNTGDSVLVYAGSAFDSTLLYLRLQYYSRTSKKLQIASVYREQMVNAGVHLFKFRMPGDAIEQASITSFFIKNNEVYRHGELLYISKPAAHPSIIIEQFRSKLTPGQQTTFSVSVKTNDHKVAAELISTMYDASLNKLQEHTWDAPYFGSLGSLEKTWPYDFKRQASDNSYRDLYQVEMPDDKKQLWWMPYFVNVPSRLWDPYWGDYVMGDYNNALQGSVFGLDIAQTAGLNEVIVVGYGTSIQRLSTSNVKVSIISSDITIRVLHSLVGDNKPLVLLDGMPVNADMSGVNVAEITEVMVLKDADATAIYGSRAANGVIIISTKGAIKLPEINQEPVVKVRSNFNELAFFYPAVYADRHGYYRFTFAAPESLTEWNWKLFAHTKNAQFAYAERKLTTQLPFMVQANMPRQLYQGDRLVLKTRISNLDSLRRTGKVICKAEDAVSGADITDLIIKNKETGFDVAAQSNTVAGVTLNVPVNQLNPIKIIIKAITGEYSDGEEHIIPVMTDKVLVKQAVQFNLTSQADTTISLPAVKDVYGIGLSIQPKPQGALINSLPYLANYSFDCAEQTFNKMLANITALGVMHFDKELQQLYTVAKRNTDKRNAPVLAPELLNEQAMPWLQLNSRSALQQKQLAELLDTARAKNTINDHLEKLRSLQKSDGGLSWFAGGTSDEYITAYVVAGFGKLTGNPGAVSLLKESTTADLIYKMIQYLDDIARHNSIYSAYARGLWKTAYPVTPARLVQLQQIIKQQWEQGGSASLYQQALLIITTMQWFNEQDIYYKKSLQQLEHIRQQSIEDAVNGIRWKALADETDMTISVEETLALLAEAFGKSGNAVSIYEGITTWLLSSKTDHQWHSTKAAAAAISILQQSQCGLTGTPDNISANINGQNVAVTNNLISGEPFSFVRTNVAPQTLAIKKAGSKTVSGNSVVYHFQPASQLDQYKTDIQLSKKLFIYNEQQKNWQPIGDAHVLKIADRVKVVLTIQTAVNLPYVYIDDKSGGAFEAADLNSGYEYGERIGYYQSVRDAGMQFFASLIPAGKTNISYELKVTQEGTFTNGPACLQCMYKPEKAAYSNSTLINTRQ